jgi:hypothetical protein
MESAQWIRKVVFFFTTVTVSIFRHIKLRDGIYIRIRDRSFAKAGSDPDLFTKLFFTFNLRKKDFKEPFDKIV